MSAAVQDSLVSTACSTLFCLQGFALGVACVLLLALHYEVINLSVKSGAWGEQLVGCGGCKKGQEAPRTDLSSRFPKTDPGHWRHCRDAATGEDRREHPHEPFCSPAPPEEYSHSLSLTPLPPRAACALLTGLAKKVTLQGGSKRGWGQQAFLNFFVCVWTQ